MTSDITHDHDEGDDHYYAAGYSVEVDPYVYPNGVLINLLNIQDTASLGEAETDFASVRIIQLQEVPIEGDLSLTHLKAIHRFIFQDIYPWAGECRKVDIAKNDTVFLAHQEIEAAFHDMWLRLKQTDFLALLKGDLKSFAAEAGVAFGCINHIHPFREGNGRTQREYLDCLARRAGFVLEWGGVSKLAMKDACVSAVTDPECKALAKLIQLSAKKR